MMHHRWSFPDKYRALLIAMVLVVSSLGTSAQVYQRMPNRYNIREAIFDSSLGIPYGTTPSLRNSIEQSNPGRLFYNSTDSSVQVWTGTQWLNVGGGTAINWGDIGGTLADQTDLWTALNARVKYTDTTLMLASYLRASDTMWLHNAITSIQTVQDNTVYTNGLLKTGNQVVALYQQSIWNAGQIQGYNVAATAPTDGQVLKFNADNNRYEPQDESGGSAGADNTNIGSGYRILKQSGQELKTLFGSYGLDIDSTTNTNGLTFTIDSTKWATQDDLNSIVGNLQAVTDAGNTTTNHIQAFSYSADDGNAYYFNRDASGNFISNGWIGLLGHNSSTGEIYLQTSLSSGTAGGTPSYGVIPFSVAPGGNIKMASYGSGSITGTATFGAAWDAAGNLIEVALGGGGGSTPTLDAVLAEGGSLTSFYTIGGGSIIFDDVDGGWYLGNQASQWAGMSLYNSHEFRIESNSVTNGDYAILRVMNSLTSGSGGTIILGQNDATFTNAYTMYIENAGFTFNNSGSTTHFKIEDLPVYADDAAAGAGGLAQHTIYKTSTGELRIKL